MKSQENTAEGQGELILRKITKFHLILLCGNFVEGHSFRRVSSDCPETLRKLCLSKKFPYQEIRWNFDVLSNVKSSITSISTS